MSSQVTFSDEPVSNLRPLTRVITTHNEDGKAIVHSSDSPQWQSLLSKEIAFNLVYTTSEFPTKLDKDEDIKTHEKVAQAVPGLTNPGGSVCRIVDFSPGNNAVMHRTTSLDYGVVLEGEMEMSLDSGEVMTFKRGDTVVQRATMHAWKNPSTTEWARMLFVLLDSKPLEIGGNVLKESLGEAAEHIRSSNSDD